MRYEYILEQSRNNVEFTQFLHCMPTLASAKSMSNMRLHIAPGITVRVSRRRTHTYNWTTLFYASKQDEYITRHWVETDTQETRDKDGKIVRKIARK
jgi:hypothetical protein